MRHLQIPVPEALVERCGGEEQAADRIARAAILQLLRDGDITSVEAAETLNLTRREVLEMMARNDIPVADYDPAELSDVLSALRHRAP